MNAKEYLQQARRLDQKIRVATLEIEDLHRMACSISAVQYTADRVQSSRKADASFVRTLERLWDMEEKLTSEMDRLSALKKQIGETINTVEDEDERLILQYRYLHNMTWEEIGDELGADRTTVYRWHGNALKHVIMPENPIII